jgi:hypothetical protein
MPHATGLLTLFVSRATLQLRDSQARVPDVDKFMTLLAVCHTVQCDGTYRTRAPDHFLFFFPSSRIENRKILPSMLFDINYARSIIRIFCFECEDLPLVGRISIDVAGNQFEVVFLGSQNIVFLSSEEINGGLNGGVAVQNAVSLRCLSNHHI